uniref:Uncharacterized protein n=1 Tax=Anguilla anguilla TaxID=7936 RepID=A0A0E9XI11_ANGAN
MNHICGQSSQTSKTYLQCFYGDILNNCVKVFLSFFDCPLFSLMTLMKLLRLPRQIYIRSETCLVYSNVRDCRSVLSLW